MSARIEGTAVAALHLAAFLAAMVTAWKVLAWAAA